MRDTCGPDEFWLELSSGDPGFVSVVGGTISAETFLGLIRSARVLETAVGCAALAAAALAAFILSMLARTSAACCECGCADKKSSYDFCAAAESCKSSCWICAMDSSASSRNLLVGYCFTRNS